MSFIVVFVAAIMVAELVKYLWLLWTILRKDEEKTKNATSDPISAADDD